MLRLCVDLAVEQQALDAIVAPLDEREWRRPVPFRGWNIYETIAHLWYFDRCALLALTEPAAFELDAEAITDVLRRDASLPAFIDRRMGRLSASQLLIAWRDVREALGSLLQQLDPTRRVPWIGPALALRTLAANRLMETWAHGQDIVDSLGIARKNGERLRHIAQLGIAGYRACFFNRGMAAPTQMPYVQLSAPSGDRWTWGEPDAPSTIEGRAEDFCLVVTQRRNVADTGLRLHGTPARHWMSIAQCSVGPASDPPAPRVRTREFA